MNQTLENVKALRASGKTWAEVAADLGTTVPSLEKRFGKFRNELQPQIQCICRQCGRTWTPKVPSKNPVFCGRQCYSKFKRIQQGGKV